MTDDRQRWHEKISFGTKLTFHRPDPFGENPAEQVRVEFIEERASASTPEIMEQTGLSERGVQSILNRFVEKGVVTRTGVSKKHLLRDCGSGNNASCLDIATA